MGQPHVVAFGNVKGGVGKTTLAVNSVVVRALAGRRVLLIDGDEQGTARAFTELRAQVLAGDPGYAAVALHGAEIRTQVKRLRPNYEEIVIDVGGRDTSSFRAALVVAQTVVVPIQPATFDVWSLEPLEGLIAEAREINPELRVVAVLNGADAQGKDNEEAAAVIREKAGLEYLEYPIVRRKVFRNAAAAGLGIVEYRPSDEKATSELQRLIKHVFTGSVYANSKTSLSA